MLQTYEAVLESNRHLHFLEEPPTQIVQSRHVLVTFIDPSPLQATPKDWRHLVGMLRNSPNLNGDPLTIQQEMRREWD